MCTQLMETVPTFEADLFPILYDLFIHSSCLNNLHEYIQHVFRRLDLYYAGPAPPLTAAGEELDDLDNDLSDLCDVSDIITYIRTLM